MRQIFFRRNFHVRIYRNHKNNKQLKAKKRRTSNIVLCTKPKAYSSNNERFIRQSESKYI